MATFGDRQIFYINSTNRISGTNSNFTYSLDIDQNSEYDRAVVMQCSIPKSYYLIESGYNTFTLREGVLSATVTITPGNYNRKSFQTVLTTSLNSASPTIWTYAIAYPNTLSAADTGKFIFTVTGNGGVQPAFIFTRNVYEAMGFRSNSTNTFVANSLTSTNVIKLQAEDTLYIHSDLVSNKGDNVLQEVFANGDPSYAAINFQNVCPDAYAKKITLSGSNSYCFYLTDESGTAIDLNGQNMQIVLLLYKENDVYRMIKGFIKYEISK